MTKVVKLVLLTTFEQRLFVIKNRGMNIAFLLVVTQPKDLNLRLINRNKR